MILKHARLAFSAGSQRAPHLGGKFLRNSRQSYSRSSRTAATLEQVHFILVAPQVTKISPKHAHIYFWFYHNLFIYLHYCLLIIRTKLYKYFYIAIRISLNISHYHWQINTILFLESSVYYLHGFNWLENACSAHP